MPEGESDMSIWERHDARLSDHEKRLAKVEENISTIQDNLKSIQSSIDNGNRATSDKLEYINDQLLQEFFKKKTDKRKGWFKLAGTITGSLLGGGGIMYAIIQLLA